MRYKRIKNIYNIETLVKSIKSGSVYIIVEDCNPVYGFFKPTDVHYGLSHNFININGNLTFSDYKDKSGIFMQWNVRPDIVNNVMYLQ